MKKNSNKFIIYKATGGMSHMLYTLAFAIYVAKKHKRLLIIDTALEGGSLRSKFSKFLKIASPEITYTDDFSILPDKVSYRGLNTSLDKKALIAWQPDRNKEGNNLDDPKKILSSTNTEVELYAGDVRVKYLLSTIPYLKEIKLNENYYKKIKGRIKPINEKYIGVHFRNTDTTNDINKFINKIKIVAKKKNLKKIYLATDDYKAKNNFKRNLPDLQIIGYSNPYDFKDPIKNLPEYHKVRSHYTNPNDEEQRDGYFIDVYMLVKADHFIRSKNSGMSFLIFLMRIFNFNFFDIYERKDFQQQKIFFAPIISLINFIRKLIVRLNNKFKKLLKKI